MEVGIRLVYILTLSQDAAKGYAQISVALNCRTE
jgi:hypothetical protein